MDDETFGVFFSLGFAAFLDHIETGMIRAHELDPALILLMALDVILAIMQNAESVAGLSK